MRHRAFLTPIAAALAASTTAPAWSQDQGSSGFALEEVMVTAQKRTQSMQDVPISVQAFSSDALRTLGAAVISDLEATAPSLQTGGLGKGSQQNMGIRGIVDYSRNIGIDPRMGVYIDGVYQGQSYTADQPLLGLETVEILRGPQGTLFGKNTVSGAINLTTKNPDENFEGEFQADAGNYDYYKGAGYISGGLTDNLFAAVSLAYEDHGGYYDNIALDKDTGDWDRISGRMKLRYVPSDKLELILSADGSKVDSHDPIGVRAENKPYETTQGFEAEDNTEFWGTALTANYDFDNEYRLTSITSFRHAEYDILYDDDLSPFDIQTSVFDEDSDQFSQELRIVSPQREKFDWVAGLYYFDGERNTGRYAYFGEDLYNLLIPDLAPFASALAGTGSIPSELDSSSWAAYLHGNYRFTEKLELTAGVRYTYEEKEVDWQQVNAPADPVTAAVLEAVTGLPLTQAPGVLFGAVNSSVQDELDEDDLSPTIGLNYFVGDDTMIYAKYSRAFKSGGYNAEFMLAGLDYFQYDPETVDSYEAGIKFTSADGGLRVNASAFLSLFDDYQVFQFLTAPSGATSLQLTNAGEVTAQGIELETTWIPADRLQLVLNTTYVDAAYDTFDNPAPEGEPFDDNKLPYAPEWKVYLGAQYIQPVGTSAEMVFNLSYNYTDDQFSDPSNSAVDAIDSYELWNARVAYLPSSQNWELALWGKNLTDEAYNRVNNDNFLGTARTVWGAPRTYGLTFTYFMGQ